MSQDSERFAELFPRIYATYCRRWGPNEYRPSPEAAAILEHLGDTGPLTVSEAGKHFGRSQAATSELIERLRRRGLVDRIPDERDQRRHLVWLTEAGRDKLADTRRVLDPARLDQAFDRLEPARRRDLLAGMEALLSAAHPKSQE